MSEDSIVKEKEIKKMGDSECKTPSDSVCNTTRNLCRKEEQGTLNIGFVTYSPRNQSKGGVLKKHQVYLVFSVQISVYFLVGQGA